MKLIYILLFFLHSSLFAQNLLLTNNEKAFIKNNPNILLGGGEDFAPFLIRNEDGTICGYDIGILKLIEKKTGLNIKVELGNWEKIQEKAKNKALDGLSTLIRTEERENYFNFTRPYISTTDIVIVRKNNDLKIFNENDLFNKITAVQKGNEYYDRKIQKIQNIKIKYFETQGEMIKALVSKQIDYLILDESAFYIAKNLGLANLIESAFIIGKPLHLRFALKKSEPELLSIFNKALKNISQEEKIQVRDKWFTLKVENNIFEKSIIFSLFSIFIFMIIYKQYKLSKINKNLKTKTTKLEEIKDELVENKKRFEDLANKDALTTLNNRRRFDELFELMWKNAIRKQTTLCLAIIDIDFFKLYNDTYGHQAGDETLKAVALEIKRTFRRLDDISARYGGEEFVLLISNVNRKILEDILNDLRTRIEFLSIEHKGSKVSDVITVSIGAVVTTPSKDMNRNNYFNKADKLLYRAKHEGKNRVFCEEF